MDWGKTTTVYQVGLDGIVDATEYFLPHPFPPPPPATRPAWFRQPPRRRVPDPEAADASREH